MDEFSLIQQFFTEKSSSKDDSVLLGIGDDTAVLQPGDNEVLLFTTDTLIKGVHFPIGTPAHAIGHKALAVNLSDIAAMAGKARWFTLALSLPEIDQSWLNEFSDGLFELAKKHNVKLVGGDTTRGPLSITISVIGTTECNREVRRSRARENDYIFVTGMPGQAGLGLKSIFAKANTIKSVTSKSNVGITEKSVLEFTDAEILGFESKLNYPQPRMDEAIYLRSYASSMIDISDGLAADMEHINRASKCGAILDAQSLMGFIPESFDNTNKQALDAVLSGGDDYELLFTVPAKNYDNLIDNWPQDFARLTCIGKMTTKQGLFLRDSENEIRKINPNGYNHFND